MQIIKYLLIALIVIYDIIFLVFLSKSKKPIKTLLVSLTVGIVTLTVVNLTAAFTGVSLSINAWTVGGSAIFGLPGVLSMLLIRMFF